jgi:hypothetical protein
MHMRKMEGMIEEMESTNAALDHGRISYNDARRSLQLSMEMLFDMSAELDRQLRRIRFSGPAIAQQESSPPGRHRKMRSHGKGREGGEQTSDSPSLWQRFARATETLVSGICGKPRKTRVSTEGIAGEGGVASDPRIPEK